MKFAPGVLDRTFLKRVYSASAVLFLVALLFSLRWASVAISLGLAAGYLLGLVPFLYWDWSIRRFFTLTEGKASERPGNTGRLLVMLFGLFVKLPLVCLACYLLFRHEVVNLVAFLAGLLIVQLTLVMRFIGRRLFGGAPRDTLAVADERNGP